MERLYFTFGSDPAYPYTRGEYVVALGSSIADCMAAFKKKYPNRPGSDAINCADYYSPKKWDEVAKIHYKNDQLKEVIVSDTAYGTKPEGFDPIWFFLPLQNALVYLQEGSGDNLTPEDAENGIVDYLDYTIFSLDCGQVCESGEDGGELLLPYMVQDHYGCLADAIPDILDFAYDGMFQDAQILKTMA